VIFPVAHFNDTLNWGGFSGKKYIGAGYFPLDEEFLKYKPQKKDKRRFNVLVTMGGSDPNGITLKVVQAFQDLKNIDITVVVGPSFKYKKELENLSKSLSTNFKIEDSKSNMPELMANADLAITAFGITLYELAFMGVPSLVITNFESDERDAKALERLSVCINLGFYRDLSNDYITSAIGRLIEDKTALRTMSENGKRLLDGKGSERVAELLLG
jgi:spore coat polysaccharide biosynthesis predicted glycosyltransferase SpsG